MFAQLSEDGSADELLHSVLRKVNQIPNHNDETEIGPLRFNSIIGNFSSNRFYRYRGSLTTPPCTPSVTFLIPNTTLPLDVTTYNLAKKVMKFNSRYTQNKPYDPNLLILASSALASPKPKPTGKSKNL
jgi:carbonic anhydrase